MQRRLEVRPAPSMERNAPVKPRPTPVTHQGAGQIAPDSTRGRGTERLLPCVLQWLRSGSASIPLADGFDSGVIDRATLARVVCDEQERILRACEQLYLPAAANNPGDIL